MPNQAYGYVVGSAIAKGRIALDRPGRRQGRARRARDRHRARMPASSARASSTPPSCSAARRSSTITRRSRVVVAETFEQARAAAQLVRVDYVREQGAFDLAAAEGHRAEADSRRQRRRRRYRGRRLRTAPSPQRRSSSTRPTPRPTRAHAMMEPHASSRRGRATSSRSGPRTR